MRWSVTACLALLTFPVFAQQAPIVSVPPITQSRAAGSAIVDYTPGEWIHGLSLFRMQSDADQEPNVEEFPKDSLLSVTQAHVRQWLASIKSNNVRGIHLDPYGSLQVVAGQDSAARQTFQARLSNQNLKLSDRAFTLLCAIAAFSDTDKPSRLAIAEEYMSLLKELPVSASFWQFQGHQILANAYYMTSNFIRALDHGNATIDLIPKLFFKSRHMMYLGGGGTMYLRMVDILKRQPGGLAKIDTLNKKLFDGTKLPPELAGEDPWFSTLAWEYEYRIKPVIALGEMLGREAPVIRGHLWLNVPDTTEHEMKLSDGVVRLVGMGDQRSSLYLLPALQRLQKRFPDGFQPLYLVSTNGYWGTKFVSPGEEAENLKKYFTVRQPTKVPVAIWAGSKERTSDGGMKPGENPNSKAFKAVGKPAVYVIDGSGRIRHIFTYRFSREHEKQAAVLIADLLNEVNKGEPRSASTITH